jgi:PAS domain S-box-containing protein
VSPASASVSWLVLYQQALLETNPDALMGRTHLARSAIHARSRQQPAPGEDERSRMEDGLRNLRMLEREYQVLVDAGKLRATHYVTLCSRDHRWVEVSDGVCELLGYDRSELVGHAAREFVDPEFRENNQATFEALLRDGFVAGTKCIVHKNGQRISVDFEARRYPDAIIAYWYPQTA